jgi:hypothetical protein
MADTQISAYISDTTRDEVERYVDAHGVKKGSLVEQALLHHLQALRELPADIIIPPRIRVTDKSFAEVAALVESPRKPTAALRKLMSGPNVGKSGKMSGKTSGKMSGKTSGKMSGKTSGKMSGKLTGQKAGKTKHDRSRT